MDINKAGDKREGQTPDLPASVGLSEPESCPTVTDSISRGYHDMGFGKASVLTRSKRRKVESDNSPPDEEIKKKIGEQLDLLKEDEEREDERQKDLFRRWLHSPERTKKWRNQMKRFEQAEQARENGPLADVWVQCEQSECLKWRRISEAESETLDQDAPWFCHMNTRREFSTCSAPQEDFLKVERLAQRLGVKFVCSSLPEGTLVLAKMPGFIRWPAMISKDYNYNKHVYVDADDEPLSYHVEYLGEAHTHSWVSARGVHLYGTVDETQQLLAAAKMTQSKKKKSSDKSFYRKNGVKVTHSGAKEEADQLMTLSPDQRLSHIVFNQESFRETEKPPEINERQKTSAIPTNSCKRSQCSQAPRVHEKVKDLKKAAVGEMDNFDCEGSASTAPRSPAPSVTGPEAIKRQLNHRVSLVNCTKEERFSLDIQMYARNEKAFEHDVQRFMLRNNRQLKRAPCWQGIQVTPFQIFLAVHEKGGFYQTCENRQWGQVFREVTNCHSKNRAMDAKHYYRKNLLPYELYVKNEDYEECLQKTRQKPSRLKPGDVSVIHSRMSQSSGGAAIVPDVDDDDASQTQDSGQEATQQDLEEIDELLSQLDYFDADLSNSTKDNSHKKEFDIVFYDESPRREPSNFFSRYVDMDFPAPSRDSAQEVPDLSEFDEVVYTVL